MQAADNFRSESTVSTMTGAVIMGSACTVEALSADQALLPDAIIQLVRAMARRQARIDALALEPANDNMRPQ